MRKLTPSRRIEASVSLMEPFCFLIADWVLPNAIGSLLKSGSRRRLIEARVVFADEKVS